uniref:Phosphoinositide 3-kinase regulatory subunit 5 n=1 Tax=Salarias fasciatus TaxID=181472 RepID=A0A672H065_SALFA
MGSKLVHGGPSIQHVLERCLCDPRPHTLDKQLWNAGLCINRWCLEELVKRDPHNFLILLQKILRKTREVLEKCQYEQLVPLTLLFSSTLLKAPHVAPDCSVLQEAYLLFHRFLSWPEPCSSACKRLLRLIQQERRAPGISFLRLVQTEQGISSEINCSKTITVLLVSPDDDVPAEVRSVSEQLSSPHQSSRDLTATLILHSFQAALGAASDLQALQAALQVAHNLNEVSVVFIHADILKDVLAPEADMDSPEDCFLKTEVEEDDINDTSVDEEDKPEGDKVDHEPNSHRISTASSSSRDSMVSSYSLSSSWSVPSASSGVESDFSEDTTHEDAEERQDSRPKPRKKPKKKSRSLLGIERFSMFLKSPRSPSVCRRVQSMNYNTDVTKDSQRSGSQVNHPQFSSRQAALDALSPQKHVCIRRRPILSCDEGAEPETPTLVKVVVFGGDREAGRLARAYSDLQQKESKCPRLTKTCKLQFYFVPTKRRTGGPGGGHALNEGQITKTCASVLNGVTMEDSTTEIAQMVGLMDPWYERNVLSLLSLSSDVLCQTASKDEDVSVSGVERLPLLADLVLYYCRHADQPVLVQLYQAELTLAGGEKRREVFIHSLELGHSAGTRAVKAMGAASKRFGIDEEREAVPLTLNVAYNKVAVSGRSQWIQKEIVCTSINVYKGCTKLEQLDSTENLQLTMTEVLKRQSSKSKKVNQVKTVKVDKVQVKTEDEGATFAVCLDQDQKKFIQKVTSCEVSLCCKPGSGSDWRSYKPSPGQVQPLHPSYCSLLCLPITSFSASTS